MLAGQGASPAHLEQSCGQDTRANQLPNQQVALLVAAPLFRPIRPKTSKSDPISLQRHHRVRFCLNPPRLAEFKRRKINHIQTKRVFCRVTHSFETVAAQKGSLPLGRAAPLRFEVGLITSDRLVRFDAGELPHKEAEFGQLAMDRPNIRVLAFICGRFSLPGGPLSQLVRSASFTVRKACGVPCKQPLTSESVTRVEQRARAAKVKRI